MHSFCHLMGSYKSPLGWLLSFLLLRQNNFNCFVFKFDLFCLLRSAPEPLQCKCYCAFLLQNCSFKIVDFLILIIFLISFSCIYLSLLSEVQCLSFLRAICSFKQAISLFLCMPCNFLTIGHFIINGHSGYESPHPWEFHRFVHVLRLSTVLPLQILFLVKGAHLSLFLLTHVQAVLADFL